MSESDPGSVPKEHTAGDVGARRHSVGEAVPPDEGHSLNVPPTKTAPPEAAERERPAAEGKRPAAGRDRPAAEPLPTGEEPAVKEAASDLAAEAKGRPKLMWAAAGTIAMLIVRRVMKRRRARR